MEGGGRLIMLEHLLLLAFILLIDTPIAFVVVVFVIGFGDLDKKIKKKWYRLKYRLVRRLYYFYCRRLFYYAEKIDRYEEEIRK